MYQKLQIGDFVKVKVISDTASAALGSYITHSKNDFISTLRRRFSHRKISNSGKIFEIKSINGRNFYALLRRGEKGINIDQGIYSREELTVVGDALVAWLSCV